MLNESENTPRDNSYLNERGCGDVSWGRASPVPRGVVVEMRGHLAATPLRTVLEEARETLRRVEGFLTDLRGVTGQADRTGAMLLQIGRARDALGRLT